MTFSEIQKNNIEQKPKSNNKIIGNLGEEIACKFYLQRL